MDIACAVVTGAASGIGKALAATRLASTGTRLVLADVRAPALAEVAAALGAVAMPTDVADPRAMRALAVAAPDAELVCLNAGIVGSALGPPWEVGSEQWDRVMAVNVGAVVNGLRAFVPRLVASGRPGRVLITASLAGLATFPGGGAYGASKHAVVAIAEQAALALADTRVGVTLLCPALVRTAMSPVGDDPADVAELTLAAVHEGRFAVIPEEWRVAVRQRAEHLASGRPPVPPTPQNPELAGSWSCLGWPWPRWPTCRLAGRVHQRVAGLPVRGRAPRSRRGGPAGRRCRPAAPPPLRRYRITAPRPTHG